jgi:phosphopantothenoylcysteine decarboxylase/phosphopantothenate--cysteine ligase
VGGRQQESCHDERARRRLTRAPRALGTSADLVVIAPATANTLAKMAAGIADDLLGVTLLATTAPVVVAPAMHTAMWEHAATQANIATSAPAACTWWDRPTVRSPAATAGRGAWWSRGDRRGGAGRRRRASGGSRGAAHRRVDRRHARAHRSGALPRQPLQRPAGAELALAAADRGAEVVLVAAHVDEGARAASRHTRITMVRVGTAAELEAAMTDAAAAADVVAMVAAVADYRVAGGLARKAAQRTACRGWSS